MWSLLSNPVLIPALVVLLTAAVVFYKRQYNYWKSRGVLQLPQRFLYGNAVLDKSFYDMFNDFYRAFKAAGVKFGGINELAVPMLVVVDLELIKRIMLKDFDHFVDRHNDFFTDKDPLNNHLFNMAGDEWKAMRVKLTPTFTSGKMKSMFQTITATTEGLNGLLRESANSSAPANIKDIMGRFTTDVIGSCAFGLECNSIKNPDSDFRKYGQEAFEITGLEKIKLTVLDILPTRICSLLNLKVTRSDVEAFFMNTVKEIIDYREKHQVSRKDFMHLLLQLKNRGALHDDEKITNENAIGKSGKTLLTLEEIAAQCFVFFLAGFETSSTLMSFALLELSQQQEVQSKLRDEIVRVLKKHDNQLTYESVAEMKYLDCVLQESLRKYPPVAGLERKCTKPYKIPGTSIVLEKGIKLIIPIAGIQMDEDYFPDPEKFDPERFNEENKRNIPNCAHMPFGEGPRNCIGLRFGLLQAKVGIVTAIRNYKLTLSEKMKFPLKFDPISAVTAVEGDIWLNVDKL